MATGIDIISDTTGLEIVAALKALESDIKEEDRLLGASLSDIKISGSTITLTYLNGSSKTITVQNASDETDGFMTSADKVKLDGVEEGANKTVVDTELRPESLNPIANDTVDAALAKKANLTDFTNLADGLGYNNADWMYDADNTLMEAVGYLADEVMPSPVIRRLSTKQLTASGGSVSWTDSAIKSSSLIDVYASIPNIAPSAITQNGNTVTVTFDAQDAAFSVAIVVINNR